MSEILIISGPTATGKTALALQLAAKLNGELVSADSRQVYIGVDIVTGKDIPPNARYSMSNIQWQGRELGYYSTDNTRIWLYDVVYPNEQFNVSFWHNCATRIISDIHSRGKLPIIVGVTGLYIKSLTHDLGHIHIPHNPGLRKQLASLSPQELFVYLNQLDPVRSQTLNQSDQLNPRRLLRAIELATSPLPSPSLGLREGLGVSYQVSLTAPRQFLYDRINHRVLNRISAGAEQEVKSLVQHYGWSVPGLHVSGYQVWQDYFTSRLTLEQVITNWQLAEHRDCRHQSTWFAKHPGQLQLSVDQDKVFPLALAWYNKLHAAQD